MKTSRLLTLGLLISTFICRAQEIGEPGWFNAGVFLEPAQESVTNVAQGAESFGPLGAESNLSVAEVSTPEIEALARGLENDPKRIFDYVHDHIRHVLYFGSKKGAQLTLLERSGNDFDQCALLVALLRAAGYSPSYQFGVLQMPYDSPDHYDVHHWLALSLVNTNWSGTQGYFGYALGSRGYPYMTYPSGTNIVAFHRVWVKLTIDSTDYYLDPAFKISEPITGIDLHSAMGLDTNAIMTAAGGTNTADYVQNLSEGNLRNNLRDYTANLLAYIQSNYPNASVEEILSGQQIVSSANVPLSQSLAFSIYTSGGQLPVVDWDNQPTNLMSRLSISFSGTNYQWFMPQLQGQRLSLTFSNNGVARLWQDDAQLLQTTTTGGRTIPVVLSVNHPHGTWNIANNTLTDTGQNDQTDYAGKGYQRTNATYALLYAFEMDSHWLRKRQEKLAEYRQQGLADTSREVVSETLNIMGLTWFLQTDAGDRALATQLQMLPQRHHRLGRMGQEQSRGYYIDTYLQLTGVVPANGNSAADGQRVYKTVDLMSYFSSAMEHGLIEQMQSGNLVAASTVKMLQLGNTNGLKTFLANSNNWSTVSPQLVNYDLNGLYYFITNNFNLLLPADGAVNIAGPGSWGGYGAVAIGFSQGYRASAMMIGGAYFGGYGSDPNATVDPGWTFDWGSDGQYSFDPNGPFNPNPTSPEPVDLASGAFLLDKTDLDLGRSPPRGISFARYYSSARRDLNSAGLTHGWTHNYFFKLSEISAPEAGLGWTTPAQMAPMLVATRAALELYNPQPNPKNWLVTSLVAKWGIDQLLDNSVAVTLGKDTIQFIRQPDSTFTPPANCTMTLLKTNSVYWLQERHGNTFKFNTAGRLTNIVDQYNQSLKLTYGTGVASNWVTQVTDWKNRTLTLTYSGSPSRLTSISDGSRSVGLGYATTYSSQGDLTSVTDPENKTSAYLYDTNHQIVATRDALNQLVVSNVYDGFSRVVTQYSQASTSKVWQFLWSDYVNTEQDPAGGRRRFFFDDKRRQIGMQDALGNLTQTFFDGQDHVVGIISPLNETNQFVYDGNHNLIQIVDPLGFTNQFVHDSQNNLVRSVDARGNTNRFGYNGKFQLTGSTNGAGDWVTFLFNSTDGTLTSRTNVGGTTGYGYDSFGQLNAVAYPGGLGGETFQNSASGDVTSHTNARGFVTSFQYNLRRELTNTVAPTNLTARVAFDAVGNISSATDARGFSRSHTWSATRKLLATTLPGTPQGVPVMTNVYDNRDWLSRTINPQLATINYTNDAAGRLVAVTDPLQRTTQFGYDNDNRETSATNAANEVTRQTWNARSELLQTLNPQLATLNRGYDAAGNQITLTNRNGKKWQFQFDAANRLTNTLTPLNRQTAVTYDARGLVSTVREPSAQTTTNSYDAKGRLTNITDAVGVRLFSYDANDNLTTVTNVGQASRLSQTFDAYDRMTSHTNADGQVIQYRYDANGNLTNLIYPGNRVVAYAYDSLNRLTNVTDWANRKTSIEYDLASRVTSIIRPNGTQRTLSYDAAGQTTNIWERTATGTPIAMFKFNWNSAARVEWEFAAPLPHAYTPPARTMTFDEDNRLATFNGNAVTHDSDGNMTSGPLTNNTFASYTYDARNRLIQSSTLSYGYDPAGNRVAITNGANVTRLVVNPNAALSQVLIRTRSGVTNYYIYGVGLLYEITETATSTNTLTYHYDYRGSTIALTDANGNVTDRVEYSSYATTTYRSGTNDTPFLFNGRYGVQTDANGLLYMRARYYNPYLCRFINQDPAGFAGGLNFYAYADGNPVSMMDPFGLGAMGENGGGSWVDRAGRWFDKFIGTPTETAVVYGLKGLGQLAVGVFDFAGQVISSREGALLLMMMTKSPAGAAAGAEIGAARAVAAETTALSPYRVTTAGETFIRYESGAPAFSRVTAEGGLIPRTYAAPASEGLLPQFSLNAQYNLWSPEIPRVNAFQITPPAGTSIIGPRPVMGGLGNEVIFPMGVPPGSVGPVIPVPPH